MGESMVFCRFSLKKTVVLFWFSLGDRGWPMFFDQTMKNPPRMSFNLKGPRSLPQDISFQHIHQIILPLNNIPPHVVTPHFQAGPPMEPHFHTIYLPIQYIQWGSMHPPKAWIPPRDTTACCLGTIDVRAEFDGVSWLIVLWMHNWQPKNIVC